MILKLENYDSQRVSFIVEHKGKRVDRVWYANPYGEFPAFETFDFALVGYIMKAMRLDRDLTIKGPVYEQTLNNIMDYQKQINEWWPKYNIVDIDAIDVKAIKDNTNDKYICSCTLGVDSTFTSITRKSDVGAVLYIAGCDVNLSRIKELEDIRKTITDLFKDTEIKVKYIESNLKNILGDYEKTHACQILSVAWLFAPLYRGFIVSDSAIAPDYPWGANAITNPLLGNDYFEIIYEIYIDRTHKIKRIYHDWPEAYNTLRVCWENTRRSCPANENCCKCAKCIRALLSFKALGIKKPDSFKKDITIKDLEVLKHPKHDYEILFLQYLYENAKEYGREDMELFKKVKEIFDVIS